MEQTLILHSALLLTSWRSWVVTSMLALSVPLCKAGEMCLDRGVAAGELGQYMHLGSGVCLLFPSERPARVVTLREARNSIPRATWKL